MSTTRPTSRDTAGRALLFTWGVTAAWDFACASALNVFVYRSTFARLWEGVASTVLGPTAFEMGAKGIAVGLALHLSVAFAWSGLFIAACVASPALRRLLVRREGAIAVACAFGPVIWLVMSLIVIPLATGRAPSFGFRWWVQVFAHIPFVTLPLVFTARRSLGLGSGHPASGVGGRTSRAVVA